MDAGWLKRLKQRNVFRVTVLYAVTGYATFQIANTLLPALGLPRWTLEIINGLAQVPDLRVAGRTSSFYFKGKGDLPEIGRKLGVAHVVEGSVRHVGGVRRITAQLINVADGFHVWSENFDFGSTDLLAIQTKIARWRPN